MRVQIISVEHRSVKDFKQEYGKVLARYNVEYLKEEDSIAGKFADHLCLFDEDFNPENAVYVFIWIDTLAELMAFKERIRTNLVLYCQDGVEVIEIYDGYRE